MARDASFHLDADRDELLAARPDSRRPRAQLRLEAEISEHASEHRLERVDEATHAPPAAPQANDRIADELTGRVDGGATAASDAMDLEAAALERRFVDANIVGRSAPAERDRRRMLEKKQRIRANAACDLRRDLGLHRERFAIGNAAEEGARERHRTPSYNAGPPV